MGVASTFNFNIVGITATGWPFHMHKLLSHVHVADLAMKAAFQRGSGKLGFTDVDADPTIQTLVGCLCLSSEAF